MGLNIEYLDGQTPLDEAEMEGLLIKSITTREELDEFEQQNIEKAIQLTFNKKLKREQLLSEAFIKNLHKRMYGDVWKWAGKFRNTEKNTGVKSYKISSALKQLFDDCLCWMDHNTYSDEEIAIRFKHRLVSIHCFSNGNGRHSRLMADLIIEKLFSKPFFTWGGNNLVKKNSNRDKYILAVKKGDTNEIQPLLDFAKS